MSFGLPNLRLFKLRSDPSLFFLLLLNEPVDLDWGSHGQSDFQVADVLTQFWGVDRKEAVADDHWVQAELVGHEIEGVDFVVGGFHGVADGCEGDLD